MATLFTTRTWTFKQGCDERGRAALEDLHRVATHFPGVSVHLYRDQDVRERYVTLGEWPGRTTFKAFVDHPDMEQVRATLRNILAEIYPVDNAIVMEELIP